MKAGLFVLTAIIITLSASANFILPDTYKKQVTKKRVCVKREVVDGNVITYWERDGKPDYILPPVETNKLKQITGVKQNNPIANELASVREHLKTALLDNSTLSNRLNNANGLISKLEAKQREQIDKLNDQITEYQELKVKYPLLTAVFDAQIAKTKLLISALELSNK